MRMTTLKTALVPTQNERGIALVVALLVTTLLLITGTLFMSASLTEKTISSNEVEAARAFYLAESGIQHAKKSLQPLGFSAVLNGTQSVFAGGNTVNLAGGSYAVQVTNNIGANGFPRGTIPADLLGSATVDNDDIIVVTSTAAFRSSQQIVETVLQKISTFPSIPGAVVQVSNGLNDLDVGTGGKVNGFNESGDCGPGSDDRAGSFHRGTSWSLNLDGKSQLKGTPPERAYNPALDGKIWDDPDAVVAMIEKWMNDPAAVKITGDTPPKDLGTDKKPQITVWTPDPTATPGSTNKAGTDPGAEFKGYGILIMVGRVDLITKFEFNGLIVAYGGKEMSIQGSESQKLKGAILAADKTYTEVGVWNKADVQYNCDALKQYAEPLGGGSGPLQVRSWRQR